MTDNMVNDATPVTAERLFLTFHYPEVKDLSKHFLTLISGTIVFSITFAEKIVDFQNASGLQQALLVLAYVFLVSALILSGLGLFTIFLAAEKASGSLIYKYQDDFRTLAKRSYAFLDVAALLYGVGLVSLVSTGLLRFLA